MLKAFRAPRLVASIRPRASRWKKGCKLTAFFFVLLYLGCSPILLYSAFEFSPWRAMKYETESPGMNREDVFFVSKNGSRLHGWYFRKADAIKTVLLHHGSGGNVATYLNSAHTFVKSGANVLLYDYEGFGLSAGQPTNANLCNDAEAAYQFLLEKKQTKPKQIVEAGISIGTGLACRMADQHPCAAVILVSPYRSLESIAQHHLPFLKLYPSILYPQPNLGAGNLFRDKRIPLLMIHSVNDRLLPIAQADQIYSEAREPKTYIRVQIDGAGHLGDLCDLPTVTRFLNQSTTGGN